MRLTLSNPIVITYFGLVTVWLFCMSFLQMWHLVPAYWPLMLTMVAGAFIAGSTSEGGGAVAFPVFTLIFGLSPLIARDFALMIQSVGMGMATYMILRQGSPFWRSAIMPTSLGGAVGIYVGIVHVSPLLSPDQVKIFFVSIWIAFAAVLAFTHLRSEKPEDFAPPRSTRNNLIFVFVGIIGGIVSGLSGSGIDMVTFTLMTLYFGIPVNVATPTSVILMFINSLVGASFLGISGSIHPTAMNIWWTCVPVVSLCAPLGAQFIKGKSSKFLAYVIIGLCIIQFCTAFFILKPSSILMGFGLTTVFVSTLAFILMFKMGRQNLTRSSI